MCGIAGYWNGAPLGASDNNEIKKMLEAIRHRGPDNQDAYLDKTRGLAMGHARLSIIDLHTGDQPLYSRDKKLVLTTNGEFYEYKRIRSDLMSRGERFITKSDSEIAISLYQRFGLEFVDHLRGEFAFALFDQENDQLILVRDRFGIRPLFYHIQNDNLYYGSEVKALLAHSRIPAQLDPKAALHQLMQTMVPGTTAFKGIHALKPGHMLIASRKKGRLEVREKCYWDMEFPTWDQPKTSIDEKVWIERVREKLIEAVTLRLEADVPVGCYLSGGIDSCSILGLATGAQQAPVKAFTISFEHDDYDEASIAEEMAKSMNADQEVLNIAADDLYGDNYIKTLWHSERTFYNTLGVAKWCMSKRVHECGYKVVVTGEGSDELFGGYPFFKRDMFLHGLALEQRGKVDLFHEELEKSNKIFRGAILSETKVSHPAFEKLCGFTPSWIQPWMQTLEVARPLLNDDLQKELKGYDPIEAIAESLNPSMLEGRHPLDKVQYSWIKTMLEGQILNWGGDRVDMANAMESRPPFLDHHLAELAAHIPPSLRIKGNVEKYVLREAVKGVLPEILYKREKFAFMAPPAHTTPKKREALKNMKEEFLSSSSVEKAGFLDGEKLNRFLKDYREDQDPTSLVRKDALINHILGLHIIDHLFIT